MIANERANNVAEESRSLYSTNGQSMFGNEQRFSNATSTTVSIPGQASASGAGPGPRSKPQTQGSRRECVAVLSHPITRTDLRERGPSRRARRNSCAYMCAGCGELFDLTDREKANNLKILDDEAAHAVQAGNWNPLLSNPARRKPARLIFPGRLLRLRGAFGARGRSLPIILYSTARHSRPWWSGFRGRRTSGFYLVPSGNFPELPGFEAQIHEYVVISQPL